MKPSSAGLAGLTVSVVRLQCPLDISDITLKTTCSPQADLLALRRVFGFWAASGLVPGSSLLGICLRLGEDLSLDIAAGDDDPGPLGLHGWIMLLC